MMNKALLVVCVAVVMPLAYADQGGFLNSGGSLAGGSPVANPPGTLTISGNTLMFLTADGSTVINATFTTSSTVESCSGGGKGGHVTCSYTFTGTFSGTLMANGYTQAINGSTDQVYGTMVLWPVERQATTPRIRRLTSPMATPGFCAPTI